MRSLFYAALVGLSIGIIGSASAGPAVTTFDWTATAGFTSWRDSLSSTNGQDKTFVDAVPGGAQGGAATGGTTSPPMQTAIEWGGGTTASGSGVECRTGVCRGGDAARAGITITNMTSAPAVSTITSGTTTDLTFNVAEITHNNQSVFYNSVGVNSASISGNFSMQIPGGVGLMNKQFNLEFMKTPSLGTQYGNQLRCAAGTSGAGGCQDIFAMSLADYNKSFDKQVVAYNGNEYTYSFLGVDGAGNNFKTLSDEACAQAGFGTGCVGFTSATGTINTAKIQLKVSIRPLTSAVPEPASFGILAMGFAGLAFARRRRAN